jgi:phage N-6-adenine-methyltransferase
MTAYMPPSETVEWATPQNLFDELNAEFGFTLDVCATPENAKCDNFFTKEQNALIQDWNKNVCWMNPPYGKVINDWMAKAWEESLKGATVVALVPSRTDTRWFHNFAIQNEVRFIKGRLKFGGSPNPAPFPNCIVIFRGK